MEPDRTLSFCPIEHPDARVRRFGFNLTDEYVEHCWSARIGPSSTLLLRRLPSLWVARVPADVDEHELSRSLGFGAGDGENGRLTRTLKRLVHFGLARSAATGAGLDVYHKVPALDRRQLERVPRWTRRAHERLLAAHVEQIISEPLQADVASISARLDRVRNGAARAGRNPAGRGHGLER